MLIKCHTGILSNLLKIDEFGLKLYVGFVPLEKTKAR